jgi:hypothetical protein
MQADGYTGIARHARHQIDVVLAGEHVHIGPGVPCGIDTAPRRIDGFTLAIPVSSPWALRTVNDCASMTPAVAASPGDLIPVDVDEDAVDGRADPAEALAVVTFTERSLPPRVLTGSVGPGR